MLDRLVVATLTCSFVFLGACSESRSRVACGEGGEGFTDAAGRYCSYIVIVGGFDCPAELPYRFDLGQGAVCADRPIGGGDLPDAVCRRFGEDCPQLDLDGGGTGGDGGRIWEGVEACFELTQGHAGQPCRGDFVCHGDCPCGSVTITCENEVIVAEGNCIDCPDGGGPDGGGIECQGSCDTPGCPTCAELCMGRPCGTGECPCPERCNGLEAAPFTCCDGLTQVPATCEMDTFACPGDTVRIDITTGRSGCGITCGEAVCGPSEICVQDCRCGPQPECVPGGVNCGANEEICTTAAGEPGCRFSCTSPPPRCEPIDPACLNAPACGTCFENDPCTPADAGRCSDPFSFIDWANGQLICECA